MFNVLYNPLAGHTSENELKNNLKTLVEDELEFYDVTKIENLASFLDGKQDKILLVGGDGTLNKFINAVDTDNLKNSVWYYAAGSGNDFWTDIGKTLGDKPVCIDEYLKDLPVVIINGKEYKFINGVGYGIDGWCCEVADELKAKGKKVNYTSIAIKGLLFKFKPANATVTVDGVTKTYKRCWIAPTMNGRCYGGGMYATPDQDRLNKERKVSCCFLHGSGKLKTLMIFPGIFKGKHVEHTKQVEVLRGKQVTVKFDTPVAAQIDGETILGVTEYTVKTK